VTKEPSHIVLVRKKPSKSELKKLLNNAIKEPEISKKGFAFECFFENLMKTQKSFRLVYKHSRSDLGEVDYIYRINHTGSFWNQFSHVCVECKNWQEKITSTEMDHFVGLVKDKSPLRCLGVFVTNSTFAPSAKTSMKNARLLDEILIVPFEGRMLLSLIEHGFRDSVMRVCEENIFKERSLQDR
jgi:hypothetical protein